MNAPLSSSSFPKLIVGCLFVLLTGFIISSSLPSDKKAQSKHFILYATFKAVNGIKKGTTVQLAGMPIGYVYQISFADESKQSALLTLHLTHPSLLENKLLLPDDSSIRIVSPGLFSNKTLLIEPGGGFDNLQHKDHISFTQGSLVLEDLLKYISPPEDTSPLQNNPPQNQEGLLP
jgi:phospholipid/cholesterol/gamma-HCH transport system substrate-binding protein